MSRMMTARDYQRELGELRSLIEHEERLTAEYGQDAAADAVLQSLRGRYEALSSEVDRLGNDGMEKQELSVVFEGRPVHGHTVDASFLGAMLQDLQRVVEAIVATSQRVSTRRSSLPQAVKSRAALRFAGSFAGSFGMELETAEQELELGDPSSVGSAIKELVHLLQVGDQDAIIDSLDALNSRGRVRYMELLDNLAKSGATMRVDWPSTTGRVSATLRASQAKRLHQRLSHVSEKEWMKSYRGTLDGALKNRGIFEFRTEDDQVFSGRLGPGVLDELKNFHYEETCTATISTREVVDAVTQDRRQFHRLERLQPIGP
jgi:hypothetical protein